MPPRTAPRRGGQPHRGNNRGGGGRGGGEPFRGGRGRGRGAPHQTQGAPVATGQPSIAADHVQTKLVKRPGYGTLSTRQLTVYVNAYEVSIPDDLIRHYDAIDPEPESVAFRIKVIDYLQKEVDKPLFTPPAAYDGRKNMFATRDLPLGPMNSASYTFTLGPPRPNARRGPNIYKVVITKVATINPHLLREHLRGRQSSDNAILTTITALNVVIRMEVILKHTANSKSFFVSTETRDIGGGVELWRGYFQSVRPASGRMLINVDITTAMMYKSGPLMDVCLSFFDARDPRMLAPRHGFTPKRIRALKNFLLNLTVKTIHNNRNRVIKGISPRGARELMFSFNDRTIDVATYFRAEANRTLRFPDVTETGALIPLELCVVPPGKIMKKELFQDKTKQMVEFSRMPPVDRFREIRKGLDLLTFEQSEIVRNFGVRVQSSEPLVVPARVLPTPPLHYSLESRDKSVFPKNGMWNMVDKKFFRPAAIRKWVILVYESEHRFNNLAVNRVIKDLVNGARARGLTVMMEQPVVKWFNGQGNINQQFVQAGQECLAREPEARKEGPGLFVVILPNTAGDVYTAIKHFGDVLQGVPTQCMQASKCLRANDQYWNNVLLKINPKLGGINSILDPGNRAADFLREPTIVMGADVMHPPPHTVDRPSYASLVGSVDGNAVKYVAVTRVQEGKKEEILDLQAMCSHIFNKYKSYQTVVEKKGSSANPKRLIFFRDGVSEGEFANVRDIELDAIKKACREARFNPKITLVVVGKRHHYRFCPRDPTDRDQADPKSGNCPAGMVVDQMITHPVDFDYYLLSHGGLIGTSRPAHYTVIYDENGFSADSLQQLSFALCHIFARATRSVSIPAPVYYAHLVCKRAKNHYDPRVSSDTASSTGGIQSHRENFKPLHEKQAGNMYFM